MATGTVAQDQEPLLQGVRGGDRTKKRSFLRPLAQCGMKFFMWGVFLCWILVIFFYPGPPMQRFIAWWYKNTESTIFGITGSVFLVFSAPILILGLLAFVYISAFPSEGFEKKKMRSLAFRLWTFPVLVDGPFGVVTAAEFIGILLFSGYVIWCIASYTMQNVALLWNFPFPPILKSSVLLELTGLRLGSIGLFCVMFLFIPVARGSILLRLIGIPFEHAARYHVWLGHLTMALFLAHGLCYAVAWSLQGRLWQQLTEWNGVGVANLPGVISLAAGLVMWATSLRPVRKKQFELFFYTHQLYVIFVIFLALHVGDFIFSISAGTVFVFVLDRFLRFWQSRTVVDIVSASCLPCGTVELVFSKPESLRYNALSFLFVQVRELSFLQWHPFSVSSSPLDGNHHVSVLIKVLGSWTGKLKDMITKLEEHSQSEPASPPPRITACVEGPYGHELAYHLMYRNLILIAGGIGISPFLAVLSDIIHRVAEGKQCLPRNVLVIWSVKRSVELSLLSAVDAQFCSSYDLRLDIQSYVTQEQDPPLEEGKVNESAKVPSMFIRNGGAMSGLVGTGDNIWTALYFLASAIGFIALFGLVEVHYICRFEIVSWWFRGLLFAGCMLAGVVLAGGSVILAWHLYEKKNARTAKSEPGGEAPDVVTGDKIQLTEIQAIRYGRRPDFHEIFASYSEELGDADVGVMVCGPASLQTSVARVCRSLNVRRRTGRPVFHFNSHSFDL